MKPEFNNYTEEQCKDYLRDNFGMFGLKGHGYTKNIENRDLSYLRKECAHQFDIVEYAKEYAEEYAREQLEELQAFLNTKIKK